VAIARQAGAIAAPFLFATGKLHGEPVLLAGVDLPEAKELTQFWHVEGSRGPCLAGVNAASRFGLIIGGEAAVDGGPCRVSGIVTTGGSEDNELILPFAEVARIAGVSDRASLVQVRVPGNRISAVRTQLQKQLPGTDVRLVRAIAETETSVVRKVRIALFLLLSMILVITTMSVTSNFTELVLERSREIGILKAIGAAERKIASLFVTESVLLALGSALTGYLAGIVLAGWIGRSVFQAPFAVHVNISVLLFAAALTLVIALAATALAAGSIWRIQPARILRGE
ncbi:MAG: FtsX-like permease family protein, partial [Acidobacteriota bacterium]|nr:FtsX-like permease family protein [Acidobacteriota bacterium]